MEKVFFQKFNPNQALRYIIINSDNAKNWIEGMIDVSGFSFNTLNKYFSRNNSQFNPNFSTLEKICEYSEINILDFIFLSQPQNLLSDFRFNNPQNYYSFCNSSFQIDSLELFFNSYSFSINLKEIILFLSETRKKRNLTEQYVADLLKVKKQRISQIENLYKIENSYKFKTVAAYSNAVGFSLEKAIIESLTLKRLHLHN